MMKLLWYRIIGIFKLLFIHDPIDGYLDRMFSELKQSYVNEVRRLERQVEVLNLELLAKNTDYILLQDKFIDHLRMQSNSQLETTSAPPRIDTTVYKNRPSSFEAKRRAAEDLAFSRKNQAIQERISKIEQEVLDTPDQEVEMSPSREFDI